MKIDREKILARIAELRTDRVSPGIEALVRLAGKDDAWLAAARKEVDTTADMLEQLLTELDKRTAERDAAREEVRQYMRDEMGEP